jgi:hypothetical protein
MGGTVDKNLYWTALIYSTGLMLLGVVWWKALIVAVVMSVSYYLTYSRRVVCILGTGVIAAGLAVWIGLLSQPEEWGQQIATMLPR